MEKEKRRILVVDDNREFAKALEQFLRLQGFHVTVTPDGYTAISKVSLEPQDLVLLDSKLPDISGLEVLKSIKEIHEDVAVIVITGYGGEQVAIDYMKAGAIDFLSKPVDFGALTKKITSALKMRDAQIESRRFVGYPSLEKFFPFLAHKIRNPLQAVSGALSMIQNRSSSEDTLVDQSLKIIQQEIRHLNEFVQECLDFARPPSKEYFTEIEVNEVIPAATDSVSHMVGTFFSKIRLFTELDPQLPKILANYDEIKKVCVNLLRNGIEAMPEGEHLPSRPSFNLILRPDG